MVLGFVNSPVVYSSDLQDLAHYLNGTGGKQKMNIRDAFNTTYTDTAYGAKLAHAHNICRILAQNIAVWENDWIDFFNPQIPLVPGD